MTRNRKAVVSEDGQSFLVVVSGEEYRVFPAINAHGQIHWVAEDMAGYVYSGRNIWHAIEMHGKRGKR